MTERKRLDPITWFLPGDMGPRRDALRLDVLDAGDVVRLVNEGVDLDEDRAREMAQWLIRWLDRRPGRVEKTPGWQAALINQLQLAARIACNTARGDNPDGKAPIITGIVVDAHTYSALDEETREHGFMTCNGVCGVVLDGDDERTTEPDEEHGMPEWYNRKMFIRDAATLAYLRGMRGPVEEYTPEQCWAAAKALWEAKPEDC